MPSFWSSVANMAWNTRRSKRMPSVERRLVGAVDALLGHHDDRKRHGGDGLGGLHRLGQQVGRRHDAGDQTGALGFSGVHHAAGQAHVHRLGLADQAGQPLRAAGARHDAELDLRLAELGGVGGDDEVAHHGQFAAAAEREAGDRGDDRACGVRPRGPSSG